MSVTVDRQVNEKAVLAYGIKMQSVVQRSCRNGFVSGTMWASSPTRTKSRAGHARLVDMEECAELAKEISKYIRGSGCKDNLEEEMADVYICLDQLAAMYNISESRLQAEIAFKQQRMRKKLKKLEEIKSAELV